MTRIDLEMMRGDTKVFDVTITDEAGAAVNLTGSTVKFTAKNRVGDAQGVAVIALTTGDGVELTDAANGVARVTIAPDDTSGFTSKKTLEYDVQVAETGGRVSTPVRGTLTVEMDVTTG